MGCAFEGCTCPKLSSKSHLKILLTCGLSSADAYVGGLAEQHEGASHLGPLFTASLKEQFTRLRDGDWWYYENGANNKLFTEAEIQEIRSTSK